mmetsp:Transcript_8425/g.11629  ORF Transcript_8425/g.11629 Transcript_8425/m.11629 type:complete len:459 (-) Transcript_8425:20-1396(-)
MSNPTKSDSDSSINDTETEHPLLQKYEVSAQGKTTSTESLINITSTRSKISLDDVPHNVDGLKTLMERGSWRSVVKLSDQLCQAASYRHDYLQIKLCKIVSMVKMRMFKAANDEFDDIGDFESQPNSYNAVPGSNAPSYPSELTGSVVPFSLRLIKCELALFMKSSTVSNSPIPPPSTVSSSLDDLYRLLAVCRREIAALKLNETKIRPLSTKFDQMKLNQLNFISKLPYPSVTEFKEFSLFEGNHLSNLAIESFCWDFDDCLEQWIRRENHLVFTIATRLVQEKEYPLAIGLLQDVCTRYPSDAILISALGRIYLQMGNIKAASSNFKQAEAKAQGKSGAALVHMNKGFLALASDQYTAAISEFQSVLELEPNNLVAANNKAICLLYTCDLARAVSTLEELIFKDPENNISETVIFNLCTLYDLKSDNSQEKKKNIMSLAAKFASDSFDFSVLKMNT